MKKLNVAIAGFGVVGKKRYKILKKVKDVNIVAISDINRNNIPKDKKIKFFLDYHKLFTFKLDAIFISLPNKIAAEATIVSLKKNINVFCEKPPAKNYKDFIKISVFLIGSHLVQIILFAFYYYMSYQADAGQNLFGGNLSGSFLDFFYYSINCYTTLGTGDIFANGSMRIATGLEALIGLVLIAWTATFKLSYLFKK